MMIIKLYLHIKNPLAAALKIKMEDMFTIINNIDILHY